MGEDEKWKNSENEKTKVVVWDSKMIAMKPEKMFWTAEIELYRWVMSNGPYGHKKNLKMVSMFLDLGAKISTRYCWHEFLVFSCPRRLWKWQFRSPKFIFDEILIKNIFLDFYDFVFCIFLHIHFLIFLTFANFVEKIIFWWWFSLFLFNFGPKILPEPPL